MVRLRLRLRSDYSACLNPRTIDSSTLWAGYSAVWDHSRLGLGLGCGLGLPIALRRLDFPTLLLPAKAIYLYVMYIWVL
eukprot:832581-Amorphochlora_amoeboformis.AAC.1